MERLARLAATAGRVAGAVGRVASPGLRMFGAANTGADVARGVATYLRAQELLGEHLGELEQLEREIEGRAGSDTGGAAPDEGQSISGTIANAFLSARASLNPSNWDTSAFANGSVLLLLIGQSIWSRVATADGDTFLRVATQPLSALNLDQRVYIELANAMTQMINARGGPTTTVTPEILKRLSPLGFVEYMAGYHLLSVTNRL